MCPQLKKWMFQHCKISLWVMIFQINGGGSSGENWNDWTGLDWIWLTELFSSVLGKNFQPKLRIRGRKPLTFVPKRDPNSRTGLLAKVEYHLRCFWPALWHSWWRNGQEMLLPNNGWRGWCNIFPCAWLDIYSCVKCNYIFRSARTWNTFVCSSVRPCQKSRSPLQPNIDHRRTTVNL